MPTAYPRDRAEFASGCGYAPARERLVQPRDHVARRSGEQTGDDGMDDGRRPGAQQHHAASGREALMLEIGLANFARMLNEYLPHHARLLPQNHTTSV
jgi:hypothetical protein